MIFTRKMLVLLCGLSAAVAQAATFTVTTKTTPAVIYLFAVVPAVPQPGQLPYEVVYITDDKAACEAQAAEWSKALSPSTVRCLPHRQKVLEVPAYDRDE
jgi:hypothetical protein